MTKNLNFLLSIAMCLTVVVNAFSLEVLPTNALLPTEVIWFDDFSDDSNWIVSNNSEQGVAEWQISDDPFDFDLDEYRAIHLPSVNNGFAYLAVEEYYTALSINTTITTSQSIDLTGHNEVNLDFFTCEKQATSSLTVMVSGDGGQSWTDFPQTDFQDYQLFVTPVHRYIDISSVAGNQSEVLIAFHFEGSTNDYSSWAIDDVKISTRHTNDLNLERARYGNFNPQDDQNLEQVEMSVYPINQLRPMVFNAYVENVGNAVQQNVVLEVHVSDGVGFENVLMSAPVAMLAPGESTIIELDPYTLPGTVGNYTLTFTTSQNQVDDNPLNNSFARTVEVSDAELVMYSGNANLHNTFLGDEDYWAGPGIEFVADEEIHCLGAAISSESSPDGIYSYKVINADWQSSTIEATTELATVVPELVNDLGEDKITWLNLENGPYEINAGERFVLAFHHEEGHPDAFVCNANAAQSQTSLVYAMSAMQECEPCISLSHPMIRVGTSEEFCETATSWVPEMVQVSGKLFLDHNCNGAFDEDETPVPYQMIYNGDGQPLAMSNGTGDYSLVVNAGSTIVLSANEMEGFIVEADTISEEGEANLTDVDFGYCSDGETVNLGAWVTPGMEPPKPGFPLRYYIGYTNLGSVLVGAEIRFNFENSPYLTVLDSAGGVVEGNEIIWQIDTVNYFEYGYIFPVKFQIPIGTEVGTIISPEVSIIPVPENPVDVDTTDNYHSFPVEVVAAFDPNDKTVDQPIVNHTELQEDGGAVLEYLIRFQNTGNSFATFVRVEDELTELLDLNSIEMIQASHDYELIFHEDQKVEWYFDNIMLPDSTTDEPGSHGHIHFRIRTVPDVQLEDVIENHASIFFDFKDPVVTEPAVTTFIDCSEGSLSVLGVEPVCPGELLTLTTNRPEFDHVWSTEFATISSPEFNLNVQDGPVVVTVLVTHPVCTLETSIEIPVFNIPETEITVTGNQLVATSGVSYTWYLDGELIESATEQLIVPVENGTYTVEVEYDNGCIGTDEMLFQSVGINDLNRADIILIPNPADDFTQLILPEGKWQVSMTDASGKLIFSKDQVTVSRFDIPLGLLAPGVYFVSVQSRENKMVKKLVVE